MFWGLSLLIEGDITNVISVLDGDLGGQIVIVELQVNLVVDLQVNLDLWMPRGGKHLKEEGNSVLDGDLGEGMLGGSRGAVHWEDEDSSVCDDDLGGGLAGALGEEMLGRRGGNALGGGGQ